MTENNIKNPICYLICVYNDQTGLNKTLASLYQDTPMADILVVDDGSKIPITLADAPQGFQTSLLRLKENAGLISALNAGLACLTELPYRYIARIDAGDTVNEGRLKAQYDFLESNPKIGIIGTQLSAFDKTTGKILFPFTNPVGAKKVSQMLKIKNCIAHPSVMVRSTVFKQVGFYNPAFKHAEDYEMWRRIDRYFGVDNIEGVYVNKEISPTQITAQNRFGSSLSRLRAQIKYFNVSDIYCWVGIIRSLVALIIPRTILLFIRQKLFGEKQA